MPLLVSRCFRPARRRVGIAMQRESNDDAGAGRDDQDRQVSRRVRNPTQAEPGDEAAYRAADPAPDDGTASADQPATGSAGTAERAATEVARADEGEPDRSE
jgi:hypothetical protein